MTNYLICNGEVYDGSGSAPLRVDIRIEGERITEMGTTLTARGEEVVDATDLMVAPGLIDLHTHVYSGMGQYAIDPAEAGVRTGVTTLLDTGTAGALTYPTFQRFVMPAAKEEIYALLNISMIGCIHGHSEIPPRIGDLHCIEHIDVEAAVACIQKYPDRIIGTKVRLTSAMAHHSLENEQAALKGALEAAAQTDRLCMVHHVMSKIPAPEVLDALRPGDIFTHMYHPQYDSIFENGMPLPAAQQARERGVVFDVGHGMGSFAWDVAEPACREHGFWPDTISTDIHVFNIEGPVFDMATTMSKFLYMGMPLSQVIRASTHAPAKAMKLGDRLGLLAVGRQADITLLRLETGRWGLRDVKGEVRTARDLLQPVTTWKKGIRYHCESVAHRTELKQ